MNNANLHSYLHRFFLANDCTLLSSEHNTLQIQLTVEMDKALMNRPFYWHYLEKMGDVGNPLMLTLNFDANLEQEQQGELIHFGSPRTHQIFSYAKKQGRFIRMYEAPRDTNQQVSLLPWLNINGKIIFTCDVNWEKFFSIGLNLIHGQIIADFFETIEDKPLTKKIPDYSFTLSPLIKPKSGLMRIKKHLEQMALTENLSRFELSQEKWKEDLHLLNQFYTEAEREDNPIYQKECRDLKNLYEPKIQIEFTTGGLFYLTSPAITP